MKQNSTLEDPGLSFSSWRRQIIFFLDRHFDRFYFEKSVKMAIRKEYSLAAPAAQQKQTVAGKVFPYTKRCCGLGPQQRLLRHTFKEDKPVFAPDFP